MLAGRTRGQVAQYLTDLGYAVHHIGGEMARVLKNGPGRVVLHRADMATLPIRGHSNLDYPSTATGADLTGEQ